MMKAGTKKKSDIHWSLAHKASLPLAKATSSFSGVSANLFVGRYGYPNVRMGLLATPEYTDHDNVDAWVSKDYSVSDIATLRGSLVNASFSADVKQVSKYGELAQEIAQSKRPADTDVDLITKPYFSLSGGKEVTAFGPSISLKHAQLTSEILIPKSIDKAVNDTDVKSVDAVDELYKDVDQHKITSLFSAGLLGVNRKFVPTRWSITAVDDTIGKQLLKMVRSYDTMDTTAFFGGYLGNYFLVLCFDGSYSYELFETHEDGSSFMTDYEPLEGRKGYVEQTAGGFYAARLPILEYFVKQRQQGSALVIRVITNEYSQPLGVWVVREAVRKAMANPLVFSDKNLMLTYATKLMQKKFGKDISSMLAASKLLKGGQQSLFSY